MKCGLLESSMNASRNVEMSEMMSDVWDITWEVAVMHLQVFVQQEGLCLIGSRENNVAR